MVSAAPIFIVKLPREKTIKVGATLLFNCLVEQTKQQERLVGVDIMAKGFPAQYSFLKHKCACFLRAYSVLI